MPTVADAKLTAYLDTDEIVRRVRDALTPAYLAQTAPLNPGMALPLGTAVEIEPLPNIATALAEIGKQLKIANLIAWGNHRAALPLLYGDNHEAGTDD